MRRFSHTLISEEGFSSGWSTQKHSHRTVPVLTYSFQKFVFDSIIFVHQWSTIISHQFMILFVGIHKQYWYTHFLWWVLSTKQACFMVMAQLITSFPSECSENQSCSDKKGTAFCDRCENKCYVFCLVLHTACMCKQYNHHMFSFVWNGFKGNTHGTMRWTGSVAAAR